MTTTTSRVQLLWLTCLSMLLKYLVLHLVGRGATLLYALSCSLLHTYILLLQCNCELTMCDLKPSCKDAHLWLLREEPEMSVVTRGLEGTNKYLDHRNFTNRLHRALTNIQMSCMEVRLPITARCRLHSRSQVSQASLPLAAYTIQFVTCSTYCSVGVLVHVVRLMAQDDRRRGTGVLCCHTCHGIVVYARRFRSGQARPGQEAAVFSLLETTEALLQAFWTSPLHTTRL